MMKPAIVTCLLLGLVGCGAYQPVVADQAQIPAGALGGGLDPDVTAANLAQYAFADSGRTYGRPVDAARAAIALEYLAGAITNSPRWSNVSVLTKEQLLQGRRELRTALGVAPAATSQQVVNTLVAAETALLAEDRAGAVRSLEGPVYTGSGQRTLEVLDKLPYLRMANIATMRLQNQLFDSSGDDRF